MAYERTEGEPPEPEIEVCLAQGIREFNTGAFFECHDTLEAVWVGTRGRDRLFLQGLIQIAIACYHLTCGNDAGAEHLLERGIEKLTSYLPAYREIELVHLVDWASGALAEIRSGRTVAFDPETIPEICTVR